MSDVERYDSAYPGSMYLREHGGYVLASDYDAAIAAKDAEIERLRAALTTYNEAMADAKRWRWLITQMTHQHCGPTCGWGTDVLYPGADPDEAIDTAMTTSDRAVYRKAPDNGLRVQHHAQPRQDGCCGWHLFGTVATRRDRRHQGTPVDCAA